MIKNEEQEILSYGALLSKLTNKEISALKELILCMKKLGVDSYAQRLIDSQGKSIKICSSFVWKELEQEREFYEDYQEYISIELIGNFKEQRKIVTRSKDKTSHKFLSRLEKEGLNNSVIINEYQKGCIAITYLMIDASCPQNRDIILNNLDTIESIKTNFQNLLLDLFLSGKMNDYKKLLLREPATNLIFNSVKRENVKLRLNEKIVYLTQREFDCLRLLRTGASNQYISQNLKISVETVKWHLNNLKIKTGVLYRKELIELSPFLPTLNNHLNKLS